MTFDPKESPMERMNRQANMTREERAEWVDTLERENQGINYLAATVGRTLSKRQLRTIESNNNLIASIRQGLANEDAAGGDQ